MFSVFFFFKFYFFSIFGTAQCIKQKRHLSKKKVKSKISAFSVFFSSCLAMASNSKALPVEGSTRTAYRDQLGSKVEPKKEIYLDDNVNVIYT